MLILPVIFMQNQLLSTMGIPELGKKVHFAFFNPDKKEWNNFL